MRETVEMENSAAAATSRIVVLLRMLAYLALDRRLSLDADDHRAQPLHCGVNHIHASVLTALTSPPFPQVSPDLLIRGRADQS
ncbi:hypothetical protein ACTXKZ_07650 [Brachybacterium alimentarium]|uniref:hypothetical protein n=1 Tax=Brachybacterium alimentarium TaxID=47845 RepID=UPI003FD10AD0